MVKIYTKGGDKGTSGLFSGERVPKYSPYLHAYGNVDELCALIGIAISLLKDDDLVSMLHSVQRDLFQVGSDLATPPSSGKKEDQIKRVGEGITTQLEGWIDKMEKDLPELKNFILPGGDLAAAHIHLARTTCRRAERWVADLGENESANPDVLIYLNRLSDFLFVLSRTINSRAGVTEEKWEF